MALSEGYKNPKIYIYNNAKAIDGKDVSKICWAIYVEDEKDC